MKNNDLNCEYIKEMKYSNGFIHLFFNLIFLAASIFFAIIFGWKEMIGPSVLCGAVGFLVWLIHTIGFFMVNPKISVVLVFFGRYRGTVKNNGFFWINPFCSRKKLSLRARNMDINPIKVNDKNGNPIMIGLVLVWEIKDTYKASFDIDTPNVNSTDPQKVGQLVGLTGYDAFVKVQADAALRKVAGQYAYDHIDSKSEEITLRSGGEEINDGLEKELRERLHIAGIEILEARINYLAYASEIASVMLRRQQAEAIIAAREKIVEGAVSMVELALNKLEKNDVVHLDNEKKANMVSNLMVVLCADQSASPVINTGEV